MSLKFSQIFATVTAVLMIVAVTQNAQAVTSSYRSTSDSRHGQYNSSGQWFYGSDSHNDRDNENDHDKKEKKEDKKDDSMYFGNAFSRNRVFSRNNIFRNALGYVDHLADDTIKNHLVDMLGSNPSGNLKKDRKKEHENKNNDYRPLRNYSYQGNRYRGNGPRYNRHNNNRNRRPHHQPYNPIPEPITATLALMSLSALGLGTRRRRSA